MMTAPQGVGSLKRQQSILVELKRASSEPSSPNGMEQSGQQAGAFLRVSTEVSNRAKLNPEFTQIVAKGRKKTFAPSHMTRRFPTVWT